MTASWKTRRLRRCSEIKRPKQVMESAEYSLEMHHCDGGKLSTGGAYVTGMYTTEVCVSKFCWNLRLGLVYVTLLSKPSAIVGVLVLVNFMLCCWQSDTIVACVVSICKLIPFQKFLFRVKNKNSTLSLRSV